MLLPSSLASPDLDISDTVSDTVSQNEEKYFNYPLPTSGEGITINIDVTTGSAVLYASTVIETPNEALHDVRVETDGFEDTYIDPNSLSPSSGNQLYVAVVGTSVSNSLSVSASAGDTSTGMYFPLVTALTIGNGSCMKNSESIATKSR